MVMTQLYYKVLAENIRSHKTSRQTRSLAQRLRRRDKATPLQLMTELDTLQPSLGGFGELLWEAAPELNDSVSAQLITNNIHELVCASVDTCREITIYQG